MEAVYASSEYQAISECIFDMNIGINMIANAIAKCEFQTRIRGQNVKKMNIIYGIMRQTRMKAQHIL